MRCSAVAPRPRPRQPAAAAAAPLAPDRPPETLADADALYRAGRHAEARALAEQIDARDGVTDRSLLLRAHALQYERRFDDAAQLYALLAPVLERAAGAADRRHVDVLIDHGLALLRAGRDDAARPILDRAAALAPDYPPAIGCARFPDLVARSVDLPRRALSPRADKSIAAARGAAVEIAYFFVGRDDEPRYADYMALLASSIAVARATCPDARVAVLTDRATPFPDTLGARIERFDVDRAAVMRARFEAVAGHLEGKAARGEPVATLYCDPDTLLARDPAPLFDGTFDVAITWRSRFVEERLDHEPFVAGAIYVPPTMPACRCAGSVACSTPSPSSPPGRKSPVSIRTPSRRGAATRSCRRR